MKILKFAIILLLMPALSFTSVHKYYVSVTNIEYVKEKEAVQIISRIFIDDFEKLLRERYDENITLGAKDEISTIDAYIERYLAEKLKIDINGQASKFIYLGKEYEDDIVFCYLEIERITNIKSFEISNKILLEMFEEQENIVRTNINGKRKSFILKNGNDKGVLNFN